MSEEVTTLAYESETPSEALNPIEQLAEISSLASQSDPVVVRLHKGCRILLTALGASGVILAMKEEGDAWRLLAQHGLPQIHSASPNTPPQVWVEELAKKNGLHCLGLAEPTITGRNESFALAVFTNTPIALTTELLAFLKTAGALLASLTQVASGYECRNELSPAPQRHSRHQTLVNFVNEGLWKTDADGFIEIVNEQLAERLGYQPEEMTGRPLFSFIHEEARSQAYHQWDRHRSGESGQYSLCFQRRDGSSFWALVSATPLSRKDKTFAGLVSVIVDVSGFKNNEEKLRQAKLAAETANEAKSRFLAHLSHEIRTPLGAVMGFSELLLQEDQSEAERRECMEAIQRNGQLLLNLTSDLLDLARVESGRMNFHSTEIQLEELAREIQSLFRIRAREKDLVFNVQVETSPKDTVHTDPTRLRQILFNVVGNAIKFTQTGSVDLKIRIDGPHLICRVEDTGIGIPSHLQRQLFQSFSQTHNDAQHKFGGSGLGLALSRTLARALGGDLTLIESRSGKGSIFEIRIPRDPSLRPSVPSIASADIGGAQSHISPAGPADSPRQRFNDIHLLVFQESGPSDSPYLRLLNEAGARLSYLQANEQGFEVPYPSHPDLIVFDFDSDLTEAESAIEYLRAQGHKAPLLLLTRNAPKTSIQQCRAAGATHHAQKPLPAEQLFETVISCIRKDLMLRSV